jgi:hypothetical protein
MNLVNEPDEYRIWVTLIVLVIVWGYVIGVQLV